MSIFSNDFQKQWNELSKDVIKLNKYTSEHHNVQLENVNIESVDLNNAIFNGGFFEEVNFKSVSLKSSKYHNVKFINCKFINCRFWNSEFVNVNFENCEFISTGFLGSKVINVKIIHCKGDEAEFDDLRGSELVVENSELNDRSSFTDTKIPLIFRNTTLSGVNMMGISGCHALTIEAGTLDEVNFGDSHFSDVILRRVRQGEGPTRFNDATAKSIRFENVHMTTGVSLAHVTADSVVIDGGTFRGATEGSAIARIYAHDANLFMYDMSEATMPFVNIWNCRIQDIAIWDGVVKELSISNSTIHGMDASDFSANTVAWDNVTLDGKIDLTNAQIKDFRITRLKRGPHLQLITTGSNIRF